MPITRKASKAAKPVEKPPPAPPKPRKRDELDLSLILDQPRTRKRSSRAAAAEETTAPVILGIGLSRIEEESESQQASKVSNVVTNSATLGNLQFDIDAELAKSDQIFGDILGSGIDSGSPKMSEYIPGLDSDSGSAKSTNNHSSDSDSPTEVHPPTSKGKKGTKPKQAAAKRGPKKKDVTKPIQLNGKLPLTSVGFIIS